MPFGPWWPWTLSEWPNGPCFLDPGPGAGLAPQPHPAAARSHRYGCGAWDFGRWCLAPSPAGHGGRRCRIAAAGPRWSPLPCPAAPAGGGEPGPDQPCGVESAGAAGAHPGARSGLCDRGGGAAPAPAGAGECRPGPLPQHGPGPCPSQGGGPGAARQRLGQALGSGRAVAAGRMCARRHHHGPGGARGPGGGGVGSSQWQLAPTGPRAQIGPRGSGFGCSRF